MHRFLFVWLVWAILGVNLLAQDTQSTASVTPIEKDSVSLEDVLLQHEAQLQRVQSLRASWSVSYRNGDSETTEKFETTLAPGFQAITKRLPNGRPFHCWWDGQRFCRISRFDPYTEPDVNAALSANANLFLEDQPIQRLFDWRSIRSYRFYANDEDRSLRQLCEQSATPPVIRRQGELIRIELGHPGLASQGTPGIPKGSRIEIDVVPEQGYLIKRHRTTVEFEVDGEKKVIWQSLEVREFKEYADGVILPSKVKYSFGAPNSEASSDQDIEFGFKRINQPVETKSLRYLPNMIVSEYQNYGSTEPLGAYVVTEDFELGPRYRSRAIAAVHWKHRMGIIDDESLRTQLETLLSEPRPGDPAPPILGVEVATGREHDIRVDGLTTVIQFWSTTCGPCHGAMTSFDELAEASKKRRPGEVQFVTVSLDRERETVREWIEERQCRHALALVDRAVDDSGSESPAYPFETARNYVVTATPTCLVINRQGRIVHRGHFLDDQLREAIEQSMTAD